MRSATIIGSGVSGSALNGSFSLRFAKVTCHEVNSGRVVISSLILSLIILLTHNA